MDKLGKVFDIYLHKYDYIPLICLLFVTSIQKLAKD